MTMCPWTTTCFFSHPLLDEIHFCWLPNFFPHWTPVTTGTVLWPTNKVIWVKYNAGNNPQFFIKMYQQRLHVISRWIDIQIEIQRCSQVIFFQVQVKSQIFGRNFLWVIIGVQWFIACYPICLEHCIATSKELKHILLYYHSFIY